MGGIKMIEKDFEFLIWHAQEGILLKDFTYFLKQLDNTGFNYTFERKGSRIIVKQEKPSLKQKIKRFFSVKKRLKLNKKQKIVFKNMLKERQKLINYKKNYYSQKRAEQQIINNYPCWIKRALIN
jgi:hypothetical protein